MSMEKYAPYVGRQYHHMTICEFKRNGRYVYVTCRCDCGQYSQPLWDNVRRGLTKSCGCGEVASRIKHGMSGTPTYVSWENMINRCNPKSKQCATAPQYTKRKICDRWKHFENFLADMGIRPEGTTLDRIDNNGHYEPNNCRWADKGTQQRNMRSNRFIEFNGKSQCLSEWSRERNIPVGTLLFRLKTWPLAQALGFEPRVAV